MKYVLMLQMSIKIKQGFLLFISVTGFVLRNQESCYLPWVWLEVNGISEEKLERCKLEWRNQGMWWALEAGKEAR